MDVTSIFADEIEKISMIPGSSLRVTTKNLGMKDDPSLRRNAAEHLKFWRRAIPHEHSLARVELARMRGAAEGGLGSFEQGDYTRAQRAKELARLSRKDVDVR